MKIEERDPCWMVAYRHFVMPGGVITYGSAEIVDFCDTFEKADKTAKMMFRNQKGARDLHVWVLRCEKTYTNDGVAVEKKPEGDWK